MDSLTDPARRSRALLAAALAIGFALRLARPEVHSLWIDEGMTVLLAQSGELARGLESDSHPPLSFLVVRAWGTLFGWSDLALRLLPAFASCASLALFAALSRAWLGARAALAALALYAVAPLLVWIAHEVRMYAMVELAALLVLVTARAAWTRPSLARWAALAAFVAVATGLHYYGALAGLAVCAQALVRRARGALSTRALVATGASAALGVLAWTPWFLTVLPIQRANPWPRIVQASPRDLAELPARLVATDLIVLEEHHVAFVGWVLAGLAALGTAAFVARALLRRRSGELEALLAFFVPVVAALALAWCANGGFQPRYLVPAVPGAIACIATGLFALRPRALAAACAGALVACALATTLLQLGENRREDYRSVCAEIAERWQSGDRLIVIACVPPPQRMGGVVHYLRARPEILAAAVDWEDYLDGAVRLAPGTRLHVLWREATICWEPFDRLRRTHAFVEQAHPRFRIHRVLTEVPPAQPGPR